MLALVACGLVLALRSLSRDYRFRVQQVVVQNDTAQVEGLDLERFTPHCSPAELRHLANVRRDEPIWRVDLDGIVQGVMRHPWVATVDASTRWPHTVVIRVTEHRPVMLMQLAGLYYVDHAGEVFKRARGSDLDHPVLTGLDPEMVERNPDLARRIVREALDLLAAVEHSDELVGDDVSEVRFHAQDGFTIVLRGGSQLALGFSDPTERLRRLGRLRLSGLALSEPQYIDLAPDTVALVTPVSKRTSPGLD